MKPKFLLYFAHKYGFPIVRPLQEEILKRGFQSAWFVEIKENKKFIAANENLLNTVDEVLNFNPDFVLVATNEVPHFFPGIKVQLFHGFSVDKRSKKKGHFRIRGFFDLYFTQGPSTTEEFKQLAQKHGHFEVVETGWSKVDPLFPLEKRKNSRPIVIFASTFTKKMSLSHIPEVYNEIKRLIEKNTWDWLITLHPKMDTIIVNKFKDLQDYDNVTFINDLNVLTPLKNADVMLSDTSSVITEFIIQNKPVVTFKNKKPGKHLIDICDANDIEKSIEFALSFPDELKVNIQEYINEIHPYSDGKSSKRVVDACLVFLSENRKEKLKRKPLNLIRKYKICKKLNYYKI